MSVPTGEHPPIAAPMPDVATERLLLRRFRHDDLDELAVIFAEEAIWRFPHGRGFTRAETETFLASQIEGWDTRGFGLWLAIERSSRRLLGYVGLSVPTFLPEILPAVEVGWRLHPSAWGAGYATEGAQAALREAFTTMALDEVCAIVQPENLPSVRVAERLGIRRRCPVLVPRSGQRPAVAALLLTISRLEWRQQ